VLLLVDSYDSFSHNLAHALAAVWRAPEVLRPPEARPAELAASGAEALVLGPGPGRPADGPLPAILAACAGRLPILGVCLGHQAIGTGFGLPLVRAPRPVHGHARELRHAGGGLFAGLPPRFAVARYHSLALDAGRALEPGREIRPGLRIDAVGDDGTPQALSHEALGLWGLQFHPESFLGEHGDTLLAAFRRAAAAWRESAPQARGACRAAPNLPHWLAFNH